MILCHGSNVGCSSWHWNFYGIIDDQNLDHKDLIANVLLTWLAAHTRVSDRSIEQCRQCRVFSPLVVDIWSTLSP